MDWSEVNDILTKAVQRKVDEKLEEMRIQEKTLEKKEKALAKERSAYEEQKSKILQLIEQKMVNLNVGGRHFTTSLETLQKGDTMLSAMFSGRFKLEKGEDGAYFIDRNPERFSFILDYLRDGKVNWPKEDHIIRDILIEAEYFQVQGLIDKLALSQTGIPEQPKQLIKYKVTFPGGLWVWTLPRMDGGSKKIKIIPYGHIMYVVKKATDKKGNVWYFCKKGKFWGMKRDREGTHAPGQAANQEHCFLAKMGD